MGTVKCVDDIKHYGYKVINQVFSKDYVSLIKKHIDEYSKENYDGTIYEKDGKTVRGLHGLHLNDSFFESICRNKVLLDIVMNYLGEPCYVHQFKVNVKKKMVGQSWPWHEDFVYWKDKDGIINPNLLNVGIFLDDVEMLSGPLCVIPHSHHCKDLTNLIKPTDNWESDLSKELTYQIDCDKIEPLIDQYGVEYMTGKAGDVMIFDPLLAHCSSVNLSPKDRMLMIITYNAVSNPAKNIDKHKRPEFLCAYDTTPINP